MLPISAKGILNADCLPAVIYILNQCAKVWSIAQLFVQLLLMSVFFLLFPIVYPEFVDGKFTMIQEIIGVLLCSK